VRTWACREPHYHARAGARDARLCLPMSPHRSGARRVARFFNRRTRASRASLASMRKSNGLWLPLWGHHHPPAWLSREDGAPHGSSTRCLRIGIASSRVRIAILSHGLRGPTWGPGRPRVRPTRCSRVAHAVVARGLACPTRQDGPPHASTSRCSRTRIVTLSHGDRVPLAWPTHPRLVAIGTLACDLCVVHE
jgi:hypothetical protein